MTKIPIAFAFDSNLILPAAVTITSLLGNAREETFYDIFILHSSIEDLDHTYFDTLQAHYHNCRITFRTVGNEFDNSFEIRGITTPAYYRLLIPEIIPEYDKIIYADSDIIFRMDLSELYSIDLGNNYIAATRDLGINFNADGQKHIHTLNGVKQGNYIQSGFIILNNKAINKDNLVQNFKEKASLKLKYQDQDILNLTCHDRILYLSLEYNMTDYSFDIALNHPESIQELFSQEVIKNAIDTGNLHFNGHKPWKKFSINFDIWWEYYRKSPIFDERFYFNFYWSRLDELDQLSLWKRIKILGRYFIYGRKKPL